MTFLFAWRYFKGKKTTNAVNIISAISVIAIAVGAAALILVLSVFNGFEGLVKGLYADFYTDIKIAPAKGKFFQVTNDKIGALNLVKGIKNTSFMVEEKAVLVNGDLQSIIFLRGVDNAFTTVSGLGNHIIKGKFNTGTVDKPQLIVGSGIENAIGVDAGMNMLPLTVYLPNRQTENFSGMNALNAYNASISGSFMLQQDFDNKYALTNIDFIKYMLDLKPDEYSGIEIALKPNVNLASVTEELEKIFSPTVYKIQSRYQQNQSLYTVMQIEKWVIYGILSLILIVAAFNMIGALTMLVLEKQKDIAVLKALGANKKIIQGIFLNEGLVLAAIGGGSGIIIATIICFIQIKLKPIKLEGGSFIIDYYPVELNLFDFVLVGSTVLIISVIAAWIPAHKAAEQHFTLKS